MMKNIVVDVIGKAMHGHFTHRNSFTILDGLTHEQAIQQTIGNDYSSWEILYHMVFWQEMALNLFKGAEVDWREAMKKDWPSKDLQKKHEWDTLVERFKTATSTYVDLLEKVDLSAPVKSLRDAPMLKVFVIIAQHNSYHLGQIVMNRKAQGSWPPPEQD
ncbi:MAG: DinB family protein [Candidatus Thorarchaeota archaeon]|nr:MAG: DinB family protein [Candidatus Thorarchaeota archaeon]